MSKTMDAWILGGLAIAFLGYEVHEYLHKKNSTSQTPIPTPSNNAGGSSPYIGPSGKPTTTPAVSPYGTNPSVTPTNCPSGYIPAFNQGYGWTCNEQGTPTQQFINTVPTEEQQAQSSGDPIATYGTGVSGYNAQADALALKAKLQAQYGGTWNIYLQNGQYNVMPASRVQYIQSIGGTPGTLFS